MLEAELRELVERTRKWQAEDQYIEVKAARNGCPKRLYDTLSAFSNQDRGGILLFGLDERTGFDVCGVYDIQDLQKRVTEQCNQMEPPVRAVFTVTETAGGAVCAAEIPGLDVSERPCYYRGTGRLKGSYIRVGDADLSMTDYEIYSYESYRKHLHDDEREVERAAGLLDEEKIGRYVQDKKKERVQFSMLEEEKVRELLNITRDGVPTLAAVMNFCLYPQGIFPQFGITAMIVPGYEIGDTADDGMRFTNNKRIEGTISEMVEEAVAFCRRNMRISTIIDPETGMRRDRTEYPLTAVREAVLNALIHRDYSVHTEGTPVQICFFKDRLEIHSPGTLYGRMTVEQLGVARPDLRNPALAVMAESMTGSENRYPGIPAMIRAMREAGLPDPAFENRRNEFVVIFYNGAGESERTVSVIRESGACHVKADTENILVRDGGAVNRGIEEIIMPVSSAVHGNMPFPEGQAGRRAKQNLMDFCLVPRSKSEIAEFLGVKTLFHAMGKYVKPLLESGEMAMTMPEKPQSKNQKYYTVTRPR